MKGCVELYIEVNTFTNIAYFSMQIAIEMCVCVSRYREMLQCWNSRASKRPLMEDLHQRLKSSILTNTYPQ